MLAPEAKQLDVLWRDPTTNPTKNLIKLSQITGAYASATIDKASKVQQLLKAREEQIQVLQQQLQQASANREAKEKLEKIQQDFRQMQLGYQNNLAEKENQLQTMLKLHRDDPKITEFVSESLALNDQLLQQ